MSVLKRRGSRRVVNGILVVFASSIVTGVYAGGDDGLRADGLMVTRPVGEESVRVASWNVATSIDFGRFDTESDRKHSWRARRGAALDVVRRLRPDLLGLQELSFEQIKDFASLDGYALEYSTQKPLGLMLGILYRPEVLNLLMCASFPFLEEGEDEGEGDDDPYRSIWYARFVHRASGRSVYFFNSHYPLVEGAKGRTVRREYAQQEIEGIRQVVGVGESRRLWDCSELCVTVGDRNTLPVGSCQSDDVRASLTPILSQLHDCREAGVIGPGTTFAGFAHDAHENPIVDGKFKKDTVFDVVAANQLPCRVAHVLVQYVPGVKRALLNPAVIDAERHFASDHLMVVADYATHRSME